MSIFSCPIQKRWMTYVGWGLTGLMAMMMLVSAGMRLSENPKMVDQFTDKLDLAATLLVPLGAVELLSTLLFLAPPTTVLGAILLTGYLGGAVATHLRAGDSLIVPLSISVLIWLALFLREPHR